MQPKNRTIWIDLDNTPHVVFFKPIIRVLETRGFNVVISARDCFQVCDLANLMGIKYTRIGRHYGKNKILKATGLLIRSLQLIPFVLRVKPSLTLSHGSRSLLLLSKMFGIKTILFFDYEHAWALLGMGATWRFGPQVLIEELQKISDERYYAFPGLKEDVYIQDFFPDKSLRAKFGISQDEIMVTIRPPATEAHYHTQETDVMFLSVINLLVSKKNTRIIIVPRNSKQKIVLLRMFPELFASKKLIILPQVVDGLNLLWNSDIVISGGGTMNREAASLGIPVYSIFKGKTGIVDSHLEKENQLIVLRSNEDVEKKLIVKKRERINEDFKKKERKALSTIVDNTISIFEKECSPRLTFSVATVRKQSS